MYEPECIYFMIFRAGLKQLNIWNYIELGFLVPRTVTYANSYITLRNLRAKNKDVKLSVASFSRASSTKTSGAIPTTANNVVPRGLTSLHEGTSRKTASSQGGSRSLTCSHISCYTNETAELRHGRTTATTVNQTKKRGKRDALTHSEFH